MNSLLPNSDKLKKVGETTRPSFIILILKKKEKTLIPYTKNGSFIQY